jgi:hypothetical protein
MEDLQQYFVFNKEWEEKISSEHFEDILKTTFPNLRNEDFRNYSAFQMGVYGVGNSRIAATYTSDSTKIIISGEETSKLVDALRDVKEIILKTEDSF